VLNGRQPPALKQDTTFNALQNLKGVNALPTLTSIDLAKPRVAARDVCDLRSRPEVAKGLLSRRARVERMSSPCTEPG
jgi:hypothetical protein